MSELNTLRKLVKEAKWRRWHGANNLHILVEGVEEEDPFSDLKAGAPSGEESDTEEDPDFGVFSSSGDSGPPTSQQRKFSPQQRQAADTKLDKKPFQTAVSAPQDTTRPQIDPGVMQTIKWLQKNLAQSPDNAEEIFQQAAEHVAKLRGEKTPGRSVPAPTGKNGTPVINSVPSVDPSAATRAGSDNLPTQVDQDTVVTSPRTKR